MPAKASLPMCCTPAAFQAMSRLVPVIESPDSLLQGAVAIAMHQMDEASITETDQALQAHADAVRQRVRGHQRQALLAHLHEYMFDEHGFKGNSDDYYNTLNSYVPAALATKTGLPITLSLLYVDVARRVGLKAWGVALPGHFLAAVECEPGTPPLLVDPFAGGQVVTGEEAHTRLMEMFGPDIEWSDELLKPCSNRHWLTRMLQNLLNVFTQSGHFADVAAMLEMEMLLWPGQSQLQRDLALVLARCGLSQPASIWLDRY
ncbi:MAG TPA: transglutaminase-like domain-containing protein, partial [Tepidisphaeraceae bacterium]|nr:transglutaminase-like domain-containing protein [Tepidisphaeraceae bacterium]